jgi:uncharacterized protein YceK
MICFKNYYFEIKGEDLMRQIFRSVVFMVAVLGFVMGLTGCTNIFSDTQPAESQTVTATAGSVSEPVAAQAAESQKKTAVYYDFEDVLIPVELQVLQDKSMIVSTPGFTSGILMLRGRVERRSLINFFNNNMVKDNWAMVSQIASPNMAILVFEKSIKSAVISIKSEHIYTYVEVGVAARINQGDLPDNTDALSESDLVQ